MQIHMILKDEYAFLIPSIYCDITVVYFNDNFAIYLHPGLPFKHDVHRQTNTKVLHFFTLLQCRNVLLILGVFAICFVTLSVIPKGEFS